MPLTALLFLLVLLPLLFLRYSILEVRNVFSYVFCYLLATPITLLGFGKVRERLKFIPRSFWGARKWVFLWFLNPWRELCWRCQNNWSKIHWSKIHIRFVSISYHALEKEVVGSCHMVVLIRFYAIGRKLEINVEFCELTENIQIDLKTKPTTLLSFTGISW